MEALKIEMGLVQRDRDGLREEVKILRREFHGCQATGGRELGRVGKLAEFRLLDLDESVTAEEIRAAVVARGKALPNDVRVGPLRPGSGGLNKLRGCSALRLARICCKGTEDFVWVGRECDWYRWPNESCSATVVSRSDIRKPTVGAL